MYLKIIFILVLSVELVVLKPSDPGKDYLRLRLEDDKFSGEITKAQRLRNRERILEAFFQDHSPNFDAQTIAMIKLYASCQETVSYQNSSSPTDYALRMKGDVAQTKLTTSNAWGAESKIDTDDNKIN